MRSFFNPTFTIPLDSLGFAVSFEELNGVPSHLPFQISALPLVHSGPCQGYRLELKDKILTYCTDTGYCDNAVKLARNTDLLLAECTLAPGSDSNPHWPHLNPSLAARIAREAHAKRLVLIHFDSSSGQNLREAAENEARQIFSNASAGQDGMVIDL